MVSFSEAMNDAYVNPENDNSQVPPVGEREPTELNELAEIEKLSADLDAARKRIDELARAYQAGERDREAFKQRVTREREQMLDLERGKVAVTLLEAIDELDLSLRNAGDSPLAKGVALIRNNILKKAEAAGIERVELVGRHYDPHFAEASDMEVTPNQSEDGRVLAELKPAYQLKGRVIRPGLVKVAKYVKAADA